MLILSCNMHKLSQEKKSLSLACFKREIFTSFHSTGEQAMFNTAQGQRRAICTRPANTPLRRNFEHDSMLTVPVYRQIHP
jgi:hypothetical protein